MEIFAPQELYLGIHNLVIWLLIWAFKSQVWKTSPPFEVAVDCFSPYAAVCARVTTTPFPRGSCEIVNQGCGTPPRIWLCLFEHEAVQLFLCVGRMEVLTRYGVCP